MVLCSRVNGHPRTELHKHLLWITAANTGPARPLETPVLAGTCHQLLTTQTGQCHHTQAGHQARWGRRSLDGVRTRGLLYHKFLDSPVQEQGVWSRFSNNRWSISRDGLWSRALLSHSVKNSSSYFSPLKWI